MNSYQHSIYDIDYQPFKLTGRIKLFEAFSGIGTQALALKRLGVEVNHVGISEIDKYAIRSHEALHGKVRNFGDISKIHGSEIPELDLFTYSFPCTDLSKSGKLKGLKEGTRSGLVWHVIRLLKEMKSLPKVLLMENVPMLVSSRFNEGFVVIQDELKELGYSNHFKILNAKDYGIPQNRQRIFMVSILGNHLYRFPEELPLQLRLKDFLEDEVDQKYFLKPHQLEKVFGKSPKRIDWETSSYGKNDETLCINSKVDGKQPSLPWRVYDSNGISTAITTSYQPYVLVDEKTKKGYSVAYEGDAVYVDRPHQKRGVVQKQSIHTLKTSPLDLGVVVKKNNGLSIRHLTPRESARLMGLTDEEIDKIIEVKTSSTQLYRQSGNAIVVDVLMHIFSPLIESKKEVFS